MLDGGEITVFAASFVATLLLMRRFKQNEVKDDGVRYPPPLPVLPVFGAILRGGMTVLPDHFMKSAEKHGPIFSFHIGKRLVVVLNSYEAIFDAMVRHSEAYADRGNLWIEEKLLNHDLRGIIYTPYNEKFRKYHKVSLSIFNEFGLGVQGLSELRILKEVETLIEEFRKQNGRPFDPKWPFVFATGRVVLSILFGKHFEDSLPKDHSAIVKNSVECMANLDMTLNVAPFARFLPMFWKTVTGLRTATKNLLSAINVGIEFIKSNNSEPTFVERFLEMQGTDYNHEDLLYILRDLCFGSTDTVSATLQWGMVELANHPEIQNRFQRELDEVVPGDRLPSLDDKPRLPYTDAVILEIMRLQTLVPFFVPHATVRDTKVLEYDLPKGCMVLPNAESAHMDPTFWKDPENFRPERFLDAENKIINRRRVIPFGLGKRSCLGEIIARQSVFLFLTSLVQRFDIRPPEGQKTISVRKQCAVTTSPTPFEVRLIPRVKPTYGKG